MNTSNKQNTADSLKQICLNFRNSYWEITSFAYTDEMRSPSWCQSNMLVKVSKWNDSHWSPSSLPCHKDWAKITREATGSYLGLILITRKPCKWNDFRERWAVSDGIPILLVMLPISCIKIKYHVIFKAFYGLGSTTNFTMKLHIAVSSCIRLNIVEAETEAGLPNLL